MDLNDIPLTTLQGEPTTFGALTGGKVALVVNVASRCGLSPQYEQLEQLQRTYGPANFTVLGCPSNQFLQEFGNEAKIADYCAVNWGVTFPMTEKLAVNGRNAHLLYRTLTRTPDIDGKSGRISWNFEKFVVHPDGRIKRFGPRTTPDDPAVIATIEAWTGSADQAVGAPE